MLKNVVCYGLSALAISFSSANATEICGEYSVVQGDTLRLISEKHYGAPELYSILFEANADIIGANPNTIETGMKLAIPCRQGTRMPQPTALQALILPENETEGEIALQFLARAGATPFVSEDKTGVIPDILAASLRAGGYVGDLNISHPPGLSNILKASTEPSALISFPWVRPACEDVSSLTPQSAHICQNYTFSDPLLEIVLGVFTLDDSALAQAGNASAFEGSTICVPQLHTSDLLNHSGISAVGASVVRAADFARCLNGLEDGRYDASLGDYQSFSEIVVDNTSFTDIPFLAQKTALHAIAYRQNPIALEAMGMVNSGLKDTLSSGEWFGIVSEHLSTARD